MSVKPFKISVNDLKIGMYISRLDRPWTQTPFPLQGFYILDIDEIETVKLHCRYVYIDVAKGDKPNVQVKITKNKLANGNNLAKPIRQKPTVRKPSFIHKAIATTQRHEGNYPTPKPITKEVKRFKYLQSDVCRSLTRFANSKNVDRNQAFSSVKTSVRSMVESVLRNPSALTWLSKLYAKHEDTYAHSFRAAVTALAFGRYLALKESELEQLGLAVLLKDIGKTKLSQSVIQRNRQKPQSDSAYQQFVHHSANIVANIQDMPKSIYKIVLSHQERIDGSGFPNQLTAKEIPLLGQIAGIASHYDWLVNFQSARQISPSKALGELYEQKGVTFDEHLVNEFIKAIGVYPSGTFVELSTGELAVVVEQNITARLQPTVLLLTDTHCLPLNKIKTSDLAASNKKARTPAITVKSDLKVSELNPAFLNQYDDYIQTLVNEKTLIKKLCALIA